MTIRELLKQIDQLVHGAASGSGARNPGSPRREGLDDHELSFDAIGRGLNGLPPRRLSEKGESHSPDARR